MITVSRQDLGPLGAKLGEGGEAVVRELTRFRLPDVAGPLVYKQFRDPHVAPVTLERVVGARLRLAPADRAHLDRVTVWPVRVVREHHDTVGVLLPRIPAPFVDSVQRLGSGGTREALREVQNLFVADDTLRRIGRAVPEPEQRLAVCRDFAAVLAFLHDRVGVVFGDINPRNAVYRLDTSPHVLFLDCDGVRTRGTVSAARQLNAPDWFPPEDGTLSLATDLYKLGLFILRCLCPGPGSSVLADPAAATTLDAVGQQMLHAALKGDPRRRPTARDWQVHLARLSGHPVEPPLLTSARLDREVTPVGLPVQLTWTARDALRLHVHLPNGAFVDLPADRGEGSVLLHPERPGFVKVYAVNEVGHSWLDLGPVAVVEPPCLHELPVPLPVAPNPAQHWPTPPVPVGAVPPVLEPAHLLGLHHGLPPVPRPVTDCPHDLAELMFGLDITHHTPLGELP
ncbi:hypothetical protein JOF53_007315 [Crossiella equi]|uniref:Protein kinase domain-containing protein n=1 Tax=Crossiella equi TaxID=130796 RepID=A0ABS5APE9_9PSEU|nr:hypothetical protein [Crossiella equi]MBP2478443.1 hypothetical protein [Crossiella equi]